MYPKGGIIFGLVEDKIIKEKWENREMGLHRFDYTLFVLK